MQCPKCQHENPAEAKFCLECGAHLTLACPQCGVRLPSGAKFCLECGAALGAAPAAATAAPVTPAAEVDGERRQLTVMFCDLVGSTDLSQRLDAEDLRTVVRAYQEEACKAIQRHEGHVAQYLGDGLLVYFGYPQAHEDDAERAVRAGLDILTALETLNDGLASAHAIRLAARVGIHTGPVVVGAMGGGGKSEILALGETTNVAARVEGAAQPDTVLVSAATQRLVAGLFVVEERGAQKLKGVAEPMTLYRVVQPSGVRSRLEVSSRRHTPFVGRQTELGVLRDAWEHVVEGTGQTVLLQGEAGLGKSRLCYELRQQLSAEPHTWLECRCSPYTSGTAFRPVIELVEQALTFQPRDTAAEKLAKLSLGLERGGFADEAVPLLAEWIELPESAGYTALAISPDVKRRKTLETLAAWNLKLGELQPIVVLIEDLHWCDPSSLELLGRLVAQSATARVLLVGTARPEFTSPWPARSNLQTLTLARLTKRQTREMIAAVSGARALPDAVVDQLVERADGIPLFAEELSQDVVEAGGDAAVAAIPVTLQDSLLARLDRLSSAKEVAQRAAVLGREFSYALLAATAGLADGTLQQGLARLVEAEIVFARGEPPDATYTFKHALVQGAAYESLLKRTRQQLHGRVVDVLVGDFAERGAAEPEVVARHAELAGRIGDAITYHQRTGEQAQARSAHTEAIGHLRHAIALLASRPEGGDRDSREATLHLALAPSLTAARGFAHPEVGEAYEHAWMLCESSGDPRQMGLALMGLASSCSARGEPERGGAFASRLLAVAQQSADRELALLGNVELMVAEYWQGKFASSLARSEAACGLHEVGRQQALASRISQNPGISALGFGAWNLWNLGWPDRALARMREAEELAQQLGDPFNLAYALFFESILHSLRRDVSAQCERAAKVMVLSEANGFPLLLGVGRTFHAAARVLAGETAALGDLFAGMALMAETGNQGGAPGMFVLLADAFLAAGLPGEARGAAATGLAVALQTRQPGADSPLHRLHGEIALQSTDTHDSRAEREKAAEEHFHRALDIARAENSKSYELQAAIGLARLWRDQGKFDTARDLLTPLYAWFTEGFDTRDLQDAKALLEEL